MKDLLFFLAVVVEDGARFLQRWLVPETTTAESVCPYAWNPRHRCTITCFVDAHPAGSAQRASIEREPAG